jgi:hypothetical protein
MFQVLWLTVEVYTFHLKSVSALYRAIGRKLVSGGKMAFVGLARGGIRH